jgi:hypothetical protein
MRRTFDSDTWGKAWFQKLNLGSKALYIYLWTCPRSTPSGAFEITAATIQFDLKITEEQLERGFAVLAETGHVMRWKETDYVLLRDFYGEGPHGGNWEAAVRNSLSSAPDEVREAFAEQYPGVLSGQRLQHLDIRSEPLINGSNGFSLALGVREEKRREEDTDMRDVTATQTVDEAFERWWKIYHGRAHALGRRVGYKKDALKAWKHIKGVDKEAIIAGATACMNYWESRPVDKRYIEYGSKWLNGRGWEEEWCELAKVAPVAANGKAGVRLVTPTPEWSSGKPVVYAFDGTHVRYMSDAPSVRRNIEDGKPFNP